jgi:hypothetical protein
MSPPFRQRDSTNEMQIRIVSHDGRPGVQHRLKAAGGVLARDQMQVTEIAQTDSRGAERAAGVGRQNPIAYPAG